MGGMMILSVCALAAAGILAWKNHCWKRDIYEFARRLEENLDNIISGREVDSMGDTEDSLWGKINEKLLRVNDVWRKKELESRREKQKMKELISDISHQTKTPVANQKIYLEILQKEPMSENSREFLERMGAQTDKLDFLFQSLVKMSRLETGIISICRQDADLVQTLGQAVAAVVPQASKKQISLSVDCADGIILPHDRKWTEEAIFNVLDNGVKYTDEGGTLCITVTRQEIFTKISIKDSGRGIPAERQAQIFTRFYREPEVHDAAGIGIGLYLAREIAELQNGYIEVHSVVGQGSDFCLYLPNR